MLPELFIAQVKQATDIVKLAKKYTELTKTGKYTWQGMCPHPKHKEDIPSFTVWEDEQSWACYGCHQAKKTKISKDKKTIVPVAERNYGTDCFAFLSWLKGIGWRQAVLELAKEANIPVPTDANEALYEKKMTIAKSYQIGLQGAPYNYLIDRGLNVEDIIEWFIGFDGVKIVFPLMDRYKNVVGFNKRWLQVPQDRSDKYRNSVNSEIFNKSYYFYGIHNFDDNLEEIRITEGSLDVILGHKYGVTNLFATLGTSFTSGHVEIIKNLGKVPVFIYDGDNAGLKGIKKAISMLAEEGIFAKIVDLPQGLDLAEYANEIKYDLENYIQENAMSYGYYMIKNISNIYDSKMVETKLKLLPEIKKLLVEIPYEEAIIVKDFLKNKMQMDM